MGNLFEWTLDWYHPSYDGAPVDGSARVEPRGSARTMRGGAYTYDGAWNRSTARDGHGEPAFQVHTLGFRCVRGRWHDGDYNAPRESQSAPPPSGEKLDCSAGCDFSCSSKACENPDGNTHDGCPCSADYCVPDVPGVGFAGLVPKTCTARGCTPEDESTCPEGLACKAIPEFVINMMAEDGVVMPATLCGKP